MSAEEFKKNHKITLHAEDVFCTCEGVGYNDVRVVYYCDGVVYPIHMGSYRHKFIELLEYADAYDDETITRAFIISLAAVKEKTPHVFDILDLVVTLRQKSIVRMADVEITDCEVTAVYLHEKLQSTRKAIIRQVNSCVEALDKNTPAVEFRNFKSHICDHIKYGDSYVAKYNLEEAVIVLLPQPIAEEICEYLL